MVSPGESAVTGESADERTGTTLRRGIDLLFALGGEEALTHNGLGVSRAAEMLSFDKSLVSRTLKTLEDVGVVERDPASRQYRLSWRLYSLAARSGNQRLLEAARPILRELVSTLDESAYLSVLDGKQVLTVIAEESARLVQAKEKVGTHTALHNTSSGRVLLLDDSPEALRALFPSERLERSTPFAPATVTDLINRIAECREHGYAAVKDELEIGLFALAVPVRVAGRIVAAINVSSPSYRLSERAESVGQQVLAAAKKLEHQLGG
jgi:IclR family transcriptional regulator, KDG regulon repressor